MCRFLAPLRFLIAEDRYRSCYNSLGPRFLQAGDYNAKHMFWGSRIITSRGRMLFNTISEMGLGVISSGQPTYWPTDRQKISDIIDFGVIKNMLRDLYKVEASLDSSVFRSLSYYSHHI